MGRSAPSIRARLTAWYSVVLSLMLLVYATATFLAVRREFLEQLDVELYNDFETAEGFLVPAADGRITWAGDRYHDPDNDKDRGSDVWAPTGEPIYRSATSGALVPAGPLAPAALPASSVPRYETIAANGRRWRTLTRTALVGGHGVVLRVSRSE